MRYTQPRTLEVDLDLFLLIALYTFLAVVLLSAVICLLGLTKKIYLPPTYQNKLFVGVLLAIASIVFAFVRQGLNLSGQAVYLRGDFFGLIQQSDPLVEDQLIAPALPSDQEFFSDKHGPTGGQTTFTISWILAGDGGLKTLPFAFRHRFTIPPVSPQLSGDSPLLTNDQPGGQQ